MEDKTLDTNDTTKKGDNKIGDVDYAILKLLSYGTRTIAEVATILQIRMLTIEKHTYRLSDDGSVVFQLQNVYITKRGEENIYYFQRDNPVDKWKPVEDFIVSTLENRKKKKLKMYKILDSVLLLLMIVLIILIIYFGKDLF